MKKSLLNFKSLFGLLLVFSGSTINAQCTTSNTPGSYNSTYNDAGPYDYVQSFTAPCSGNMQYFQLTCTDLQTMPGSTLYVYAGNVSSGTAIYTQAYPSITPSAIGDPITINITGTLPLVNGNQYSFRFFADDLDFRFTTGGLYPGGHAWQDGGPLTTTDFYFVIGIDGGCTSTGLTPDNIQLPVVNAECSVSIAPFPTATTTCGDVIDGVANVTFPISTQGTTQITWTYDDGNGNTISQTQDVVIADATAPVPNANQLPDLTNQCTVNTLIAPTATDNCGGSITGTTTTTAPITTLGASTITWSFDDGNGNISTQTQNVVNPTIDNSVTVTGATIMANQTAAAYQWLDCDNSFDPILGEVNQSYTPTITGNYAVEITVSGCTDISNCELIDFTGIEELSEANKELVKIVDFMGRETNFTPNTPLIFMYNDGTMKRVMELQD